MDESRMTVGKLREILSDKTIQDDFAVAVVCDDGLLVRQASEATVEPPAKGARVPIKDGKMMFCIW